MHQALALADKVSIKLDATSPDQLRRINRPVEGIDFGQILEGIKTFRAEFSGELAIQTMVLAAWDAGVQANYMRLMQNLAPDEIQLNTPKRPKPLTRQLEGRGNHSQSQALPYPVQVFKCVSTNFIEELATQIQNTTGIFVRSAPN